MSHDFVRGQSVAETCFSHWAYSERSILKLCIAKILLLSPHVAITVHCVLSSMAPMMHPRPQRSNGRGYTGVEGASTNMPETGGLIL